MQATLSPAAMPAACPLQVADAVDGLQHDDLLVLPMHQRIVQQLVRGEQGQPELRLYHDAQEISFDDPAMFDFGRTLARQSHFRAGDAMGWGAGYRWAQVQPLLQQLIDAEVLRKAEPGEPVAARQAPDDGARPSPLPPAPAREPRSWHDAAAVMHELTGHALDPAHLELVLPIFRVAHMALDADGRQVGEANVFPPALRLDVPTRWRTCIYAGTRYRSDKPMNVTALKAMRAHWGPMMRLLAAVRSAYLKRYPEARAGWTVGHLERLATGVLALPTWLLMRADRPLAPGALHPALSSLFRVTDGLRMVMHQMLFVPIGEPALAPDAAMSAAEVLAYAERNYAFHSDHGVCAGPQAMVEEFLAVAIDGRTPRDGFPAALEPAVEQALAEVEPALDYGLRGLQAYAVVFSLWPRMARGYEALADITAGWATQGNIAVRALNQRWQGHVERLHESSYLGTEARRAHRDLVYADMLAQCSRGLAGEAVGAPLAERLAPQQRPGDDVAEAALLQALHQRLGPAQTGHDRAALHSLVATVMDGLRGTRALIAAASQVQDGINRLLGRAPARVPLSAAELDLHNQLQGAAARHLPFLIDELQAVFGIAITVTAQTIAITATTPATASAAAAPDSAGMGLAVPRT